MENLNNICTAAILIFVTLYLYKPKENFTFIHGPVAQSMQPASKKFSHLRSLHVLHIFHSECRKIKLRFRGAPPKVIKNFTPDL